MITITRTRRIVNYFFWNKLKKMEETIVSLFKFKLSVNCYFFLVKIIMKISQIHSNCFIVKYLANLICTKPGRQA